MTFNSTLKPGKPLQRKTPMRQAKPIAIISFKPADKEAADWLKRMKSRGLKGKPPTAEQKLFHDMLASEIGCIASRKDGFFNPVVSIHHIDGRTKPAAHWLVLPLSAGNHQDGTGAPGRIAVHPHKARFEARYGTQRDLLRECIKILLDRGCSVPDGALAAAGLAMEMT